MAAFAQPLTWTTIRSFIFLNPVPGRLTPRCCGTSICVAKVEEGARERMTVGIEHDTVDRRAEPERERRFVLIRRDGEHVPWFEPGPSACHWGRWR